MQFYVREKWRRLQYNYTTSHKFERCFEFVSHDLKNIFLLKKLKQFLFL